MKHTVNSTVLGLELSDDAIKAALLTSQRGKPKIEKLLSVSLKESEQSELQSDEASKILALADKSLVVSAVQANTTLVRQLEIKLQKDADIDAVLAFQAEPLLPYPVENGIIDRITAEKTADGTLLTLFIVRKDHLAAHLDHLKTLYLEPEVVSSVPFALAAFGQFVLPANNAYFVLHLGGEQTCGIFVRNGKLIAAQSGTQNLSYLRQAFESDGTYANSDTLKEAFETMDWQALPSNTKPNITQALELMRMEISRIVFALVKQTKELDVPQILITGEAAASPSLVQALTQQLQKKLLDPEPEQPSDFSAAELQVNAIAIGCALTALPRALEQINFLQQEFAYAHPWKRLKLPLALFLGSVLFLAFAAYIFGNSYLAVRTDNVRSSYAQLLTIMNRPYGEVESDFTAKITGRKGPLEAAVPLTALTPEEIQARLDLLQRELQASTDLFPLMPNVPRVSDVLAWLSTHEKVVGAKPQEPLIRLQNFHYSVVKRPEMSKKQEKYQVKVEIEFTSANQTAAREFHDALIAPNQFIDHKLDVKWSASEGKYKAIFFLIDRTSYP